MRAVSQEALWLAAARLSTSLDALAALAAHLRIAGEGLDADPRARAVLADVARELGGDLDDVPDAAREAIVGMVRAFLRQAADLVEHPGRAGGWEQPDELLLQGIGRLSAAVVDAFRAAEAVLEGLGERLRADGATFLDVGTGTGWLAMAVARAYDGLHVVAIDVFEPALALARRNVAIEQLDGRVELWLQDGADLGVDEAYDVIWLPLPFLAEDLVPTVVRSCAQALRAGGWLLAGGFAGTGERLSELLVELRTVRAGGHPWKPDDLAAVFEDAGLESAGEVPRTWATPVRLFSARKPPSSAPDTDSKRGLGP